VTGPFLLQEDFPEDGTVLTKRKIYMVGGAGRKKTVTRAQEGKGRGSDYDGGEYYKGEKPALDR